MVSKTSFEKGSWEQSSNHAHFWWLSVYVTYIMYISLFYISYLACHPVLSPAPSFTPKAVPPPPNPTHQACFLKDTITKMQPVACCSYKIQNNIPKQLAKSSQLRLIPTSWSKNERAALTPAGKSVTGVSSEIDLRLGGAGWFSEILCVVWPTGDRTTGVGESKLPVPNRGHKTYKIDTERYWKCNDIHQQEILKNVYEENDIIWYPTVSG